MLRKLTNKITPMKKNKIITIVLFLCTTLSLTQFTSCKESNIETYVEKNALYFPKEENYLYGIDTAHISFFHNPGKDVLVVPFKIMLIGNLLKEDTEYAVEVIDSLTTATTDEYALPKKIIFRKGLPADTLYISIFNKERLSEIAVTLALKIVENDNFKAGYANMQKINLRFDAVASEPEWWDEIIKFVYLGKFSVAKYEVFITVSGRIDIEGLEAWELRQICLDMKDHIKKNGITEDDGSPMEIICN